MNPIFRPSKDIGTMTKPLDENENIDNQSIVTNNTIDDENLLTKKLDEYKRRLTNMELDLGNKKKHITNLETILKSKKTKMVTISDLQTDYLDLNKRIVTERENLKKIQGENLEIKGKIDTYKANLEGGHKSLLDKEDGLKQKVEEIEKENEKLTTNLNKVNTSI